MGAWSTRIAAADFLRPPEFADRHLAGDGAGRIGGVRLELVSAEGTTRLGRAYQQVPLRVLPPFHFGADEPALLYLLNPTAGLLDGDAQRVEIDARAGCRAVIAGQSATRIHPSVHGFCTQQWVVRVEAGAVLAVLPGPAIPFRGCRYYQHVAVELAEGAGLVWGDVWLAGRYARGAASERFQFRTVVQEQTVRRAGRLVFRDRFCWQGPWDEDTAAWHFGGRVACGVLFATGAVAAEMVVAAPLAQVAVFTTACGDTCLRWQGPSEAVTGCVVQTALHAAAALGAPGRDRPWLAAHGLAPNHWFSPLRDRSL